MPQKIPYYYSLPAILVSTLLVAAVVFGWAPPTQPPPEGNAPAPLNVGSVGQSKAGGLILNTGGAATGLIVDKGNVGIGTANPVVKLHIQGGSTSRGITLDLSPGATTAYAPFLIWDARTGGASYLFGVRQEGNSLIFRRYTDTGPNWPDNLPILTLNGDGNVGIGTTNPGAKLEVAGQVKITGGSPGLNKVLASDAVGLASWSNISDLVSGGYWTQSGNYLYPSNNNWNVGIGTENPTARLNIQGGTGIRGITLDLSPGATTAYAPLLIWDARNGGASYLFGVRQEANSLIFRRYTDYGTNSLSILTLNGNGNVGIGIGTATPSDELTIQAAGENAGIGLRVDSGGQGDILYYEGGALAGLLRFHSGGGLEFQDRANQDGTPARLSRLYINTVGNVGIGTESLDPNYKLTIVEGGIKAENNSNQPAGYFSSVGGGRAIQTGTGTILFGNLAGGTETKMVVADTSGILSTQPISGGIGGVGTDNYIPKWNEIDTLQNSVIFQTDSGNVGISTTTPSERLQIRGTNAQRISIISTTPEPDLEAVFSARTDWGFVGTRSNHPFIIGTNDTERIRIVENGNVGIGTVSPSEKLQVNGSIKLGGAEGSIKDVNEIIGYNDLYLKGNLTGSAPVYIHGSLMRFNTTDKLEIVGGPTKTTGGLIIETRSNDPSTNLEDGRMWLRTDI